MQTTETIKIVKVETGIASGISIAVFTPAWTYKDKDKESFCYRDSE